ncbi:MAG TPA: hypothetical protein EYP43_00780 [Thermoplasmata archaeon]|nr:hypothetical protein [Thermoplasmata archaeon]
MPAGCFTRDGRAQVHVMEVVTASMLVIAAIQALIAAHVPSDAESIDLSDMRVSGEDALRVLDSQPASNDAHRYDSVLTMHLTNGDAVHLRENLTALIPPFYSFNLYLSDGYTSIPLGPEETPMGDAVVAARLVCLKENNYPGLYGNVLEVQILLWREAR